MAVEPNAWTKLFEAPPGISGAERAIPVRMLCKGSRPFLVFPPLPRAAAAGLELYPAQKTAARILRGLLRLLYGRGLYPFTKPLELTVPGGSELGEFLSQLQPRNLPLFCSLAGNPNAAGQRFIFLLLDREHRPQTVVKAGIGGLARELIERETSFLRKHGGQPHVPGIIETLEGRKASAFAMPYYPPLGRGALSTGQVSALLTGWLLARAGRISFTELPQWRRLEECCKTRQVANLKARLQAREVVPAVYHGDFAAWNIRANAGGLMVIDWERGEALGPPAWDWFHYVVQHGLLVRKASAAQVLRDMHALWASPEFGAYARQAGMQGVERELLLAYVLYAQQVIKPSEGISGLQSLEAALEPPRS